MLNIGFLCHFSFPKTLFPSFLHHLCLQFLYPTTFLVRLTLHLSIACTDLLLVLDVYLWFTSKGRIQAVLNHLISAHCKKCGVWNTPNCHHTYGVTAHSSVLGVLGTQPYRCDSKIVCSVLCTLLCVHSTLRSVFRILIKKRHITKHVMGDRVMARAV